MSPLYEIPFKDFDGSLFNVRATIEACSNCGLGTVVSSMTDETIANHYAFDCRYSDLTGVGVGGTTPEDRIRYDIYARAIQPFLSEIHSGMGLVDVGCSRGGFLVDLKQRYPDLLLTGIDLDAISLQQLDGTGIGYRVGDALNIPLPDNSQSMLSYFHVFEHILDTDRLLAEANRVLKDGGLLMIEVPDAPAYGAARVGTMFWLGLKEHVYHFTAAALARKFERHGLGVIDVQRRHMPMRGNAAYPSLIVVARKGAATHAPLDLSHERHALALHVSQETQAFKKLRENLAGFATERSALTFWGIGLEFFNLWAHLGLELTKSHTIRLVDRNPGKQGLEVDGIAIGTPDSAPCKGGLICCSYMSSSGIVSNARALGWSTDDIFVIG